MGESSAFVSILVSSFSQNPLQLGNDRGFLQDIYCIIFKCVLDVVSRPQKKVWSVIPPAGKKEPKQSFWLKALWAMIFSRSSFYSFAMPPHASYSSEAALPFIRFLLLQLLHSRHHPVDDDVLDLAGWGPLPSFSLRHEFTRWETCGPQ